MHNVLTLQYPVRVLKCVSLHTISNPNKYAYWKIRFFTDNRVPSSEAVQTYRRQVQRQNHKLV